MDTEEYQKKNAAVGVFYNESFYCSIFLYIGIQKYTNKAGELVKINMKYVHGIALKIMHSSMI